MNERVGIAFVRGAALPPLGLDLVFCVMTAMARRASLSDGSRSGSSAGSRPPVWVDLLCPQPIENASEPREKVHPAPDSCLGVIDATDGCYDRHLSPWCGLDDPCVKISELIPRGTVPAYESH